MDTGFITVSSNNSVRIDTGDKIIYIDPYELDGSSEDADYIFLTHDHYDHFSLADINKILKYETVFVVPEAMDKKVRKNTFAGRNFPVHPGNSYDADGLKFETVPMYNKMKPFHPKLAGWCGYVINVLGKRIYIAGDIDVIEEAKSVKCDIAIVPIGGFYTMNYKEAAGLVNAIKPEVAIPVHYGKVVGKESDGEDFKKLVDDGIQVDIKLAFN